MGGGSNTNSNHQGGYNNNNNGGANYFGMPMGGASPQQQQQHHERLMQLKRQQQQLEMQLKQNKMSNQRQQHQQQQQQFMMQPQQQKMPQPMQQKQQSQLQQKQQQQQLKLQRQQQQLQRQHSTSTSSQKQTQAAAQQPSPSTSVSLTRPPDLKKPPHLPTLPPSSVPPQQQRPSVTGGGAAGAAASSTTKNTGVRRDSSANTAPPVVPTDQMKELLNKCNWSDRTVYMSRLLLGGATSNGFLRATATAQRIKKQRARQIKKQTADQDEEELKKDAMNPRTAKKIRAELFMGLNFSKALFSSLETVLKELEPSFIMPALQDPHPVAAGTQNADPYASTTTIITAPPRPPPTAQPAKTTTPAATMVAPKMAKATPPAPSSAPAAPPADPTTSTTTASPGDPNGSTLRKLRKRKFDPVPAPPLDQTAPNGKKYSRKEQALRLLEWNRFRALQKGDYVAAKVSSRDLWILARVSEASPGPSVPPIEFLSLSESKRDALFRNKITLKDVEDTNSNSGNHVVARSHVLPLPRTFAEAADWASRCRKGSRVYAMYPMTTSLYSGSVIDNATYCRGDDDIVVVEFDGDEATSSGKMPQYHIPARFVTLIPKEFSGASSSASSSGGGQGGSSSKKRKSAVLPKAAAAPSLPKKQRGGAKAHKRTNSNDSALNNMLDEIAYTANAASSGAGDLDFDEFDLGFGELGKK